MSAGAEFDFYGYHYTRLVVELGNVLTATSQCAVYIRLQRPTGTKRGKIVLRIAAKEYDYEEGDFDALRNVVARLGIHVTSKRLSEVLEGHLSN